MDDDGERLDGLDLWLLRLDECILSFTDFRFLVDERR